MGASPGDLQKQMGKRLTLLRCGVIEGQWVLDQIGTGSVLRKSMLLKKMRFFAPFIVKDGVERCIIEGKLEGKRRKGRPLTSWASDIVKLVGGRLADAVHQAVDREGLRALVVATAAH